MRAIGGFTRSPFSSTILMAVGAFALLGVSGYYHIRHRLIHDRPEDGKYNKKDKKEAEKSSEVSNKIVNYSTLSMEENEDWVHSDKHIPLVDDFEAIQIIQQIIEDLIQAIEEAGMKKKKQMSSSFYSSDRSYSNDIPSDGAHHIIYSYMYMECDDCSMSNKSNKSFLSSSDITLTNDIHHQILEESMTSTHNNSQPSSLPEHTPSFTSLPAANNQSSIMIHHQKEKEDHKVYFDHSLLDEEPIKTLRTSSPGSGSRLRCSSGEFTAHSVDLSIVDMMSDLSSETMMGQGWGNSESTKSIVAPRHNKSSHRCSNNTINNAISNNNTISNTLLINSSSNSSSVRLTSSHSRRMSTSSGSRKSYPPTTNNGNGEDSHTKTSAKHQSELPQYSLDDDSIALLKGKEKVMMKYFQSIDHHIRTSPVFYSPGYNYNLDNLYTALPPPKELKLCNRNDFITCLKAYPSLFYISATHKTIELVTLTPWRKQNTIVYGYFHCIKRYCHTYWESNHSFCDEYQCCPRCKGHVYPYQQRLLQENDIESITNITSSLPTTMTAVTP